MQEETTDAPLTRGDLEAAERLEGSRFTAAVYGSILVTTVIASFAMADQSADRAALFVAVAMLTYWLAHVWAGFVGARVHHQGHVGVGTVRQLGRKEWPIAEAAASRWSCSSATTSGCTAASSRSTSRSRRACCSSSPGAWRPRAPRTASSALRAPQRRRGRRFGVVIVVLELLVH